MKNNDILLACITKRTRELLQLDLRGSNLVIITNPVLNRMKQTNPDNYLCDIKDIKSAIHKPDHFVRTRGSCRFLKTILVQEPRQKPYFEHVVVEISDERHLGHKGFPLKRYKIFKGLDNVVIDYWLEDNSDKGGK